MTSAVFSPGNVDDLPATVYASRILDGTAHPVLRGNAAAIRDALPILQQFLDATPLVTYLDSHPEQYLCVPSSPVSPLLERLDIQNNGRREFAFELSKAIERSPLSGRTDCGAEELREFLLHAAVYEYNASTGKHLSMEEAKMAKMAADVVSGMGFAAKAYKRPQSPDRALSPRTDRNLEQALHAGSMSLRRLMQCAGTYVGKKEQQALDTLYFSVYAPLMR